MIIVLESIDLPGVDAGNILSLLGPGIHASSRVELRLPDGRYKVVKNRQGPVDTEWRRPRAEADSC